MPDKKDVTDFRFRADDAHNRDMLEYQSENAFLAGNLALAASFAQAAGLYAIVGLLAERVERDSLFVPASLNRNLPGHTSWRPPPQVPAGRCQIASNSDPHFGVRPCGWTV
jgi:hypothetical protein